MTANTSFAVWLLMTLFSRSAIRDARCSAVKVIFDASDSFSFKRRSVSPVSQFAAFFGAAPALMVFSKSSASALSPVRISAS